MRGPDEAIEIGDHDRIALEADQPVVDEQAQQLVHALAGAADHRREVALGDRRIEADRPIGLAGSLLVGQAREPGGQPSGDIEEVQLFDVEGESAKLARQRRQERVANRWLRGDQLAESVSREDERLGWFERRGRGRARGAVEQGQLTEEVPRAERREDRLVAGLRGERDLDRSGHHDEQGVPGVSEVEDDLATPEPP